MPIDATTKVVGVIGYPISHSLSPQMHNSAFLHLGLNYVYLAWEVEPSNLKLAIDGVRGLGIVGLNVTIPHKEKVGEYLDELSEEARMVGAVNTILNKNGKLVGFNTDVEGFRRALGCSVKDKKVVVLGAGGAGRAVVFALIKDGASCIILNRTEEKARDLAEKFKGIGEVMADKLTPSALKRAMQEADILVNATSLGMKGESIEGIEDALREDILVMDLVYNPRETPLLRIAKEKGARVVEGWRMLLHQGAYSFEIWTGKKAPLDVMENVLQKILYGV
ncbi:shikimate dehydrogenase [bacterium]|nr:shikimate dehydrogenase [bacterium]